MPIYTGVSGSAKRASSLHTGVGGVVRNVSSGFLGANGVRRQFLGPLEALSHIIVRATYCGAETIDSDGNSTGGYIGLTELQKYGYLTVSDELKKIELVNNKQAGKRVYVGGYIYAVFNYNYSAEIARLSDPLYQAQISFPVGFEIRFSGSGDGVYANNFCDTPLYTGHVNQFASGTSTLTSLVGSGFFMACGTFSSSLYVSTHQIFGSGITVDGKKYTVILENGLT